MSITLLAWLNTSTSCTNVDRKEAHFLNNLYTNKHLMHVSPLLWYKTIQWCSRHLAAQKAVLILESKSVGKATVNKQTYIHFHSILNYFCLFVLYNQNGLKVDWNYLCMTDFMVQPPMCVVIFYLFIIFYSKSILKATDY